MTGMLELSKAGERRRERKRAGVWESWGKEPEVMYLGDSKKS
jgi:hypothetical protein